MFDIVVVVVVVMTNIDSKYSPEVHTHGDEDK